jgi:hypothetical protein
MISENQKQTHNIPRDLLAKFFHESPRLIGHFENQALAVMDATTGLENATSSMEDATVITLSTNAAFNSEHVLTNGDGTEIEEAPGTVKIDVDKTVARTSGFSVVFEGPGDVVLGLPTSGTLVSDKSLAILTNTTLNTPTINGPTCNGPIITNGLVTADTDAGAAALGCPVNGLYLDGNHVCMRRT